MPNLSIQSALNNTTSNVVIGYFFEEDIAEIPPHPRLYKFQLEPDSEVLGSNKLVYSEFGKLEFFYLVTFKWILFKKLFQKGFEFLIYSDLDVVWFKNAVTEMSLLFRQNPGIDIAIQSATLIPTQPRLCMGFVAFRKSEKVNTLISACYQEHLGAVKSGLMIGDDDVITSYYLSEPKNGWIYELSQIAFPVGLFMNVYLKDRSIPGLNPPIPFIFHANYVVGERNKRLLMRYATNKISTDSQNKGMNLELRMFLCLKRLRFLASILKKFLLKK